MCTKLLSSFHYKIFLFGGMVYFQKIKQSSKDITSLDFKGYKHSS